MATSKNYGYEPNYGLNTFDPNIYQGYSNTCAIRSQEIILRDYGIMFSQEELVEYATQNGWFNPDLSNGGTYKGDVGNILDACGVHTTRTENATIFDIVTELKAGHRVIVSVDADELWIKNESNLFKKIFGEVVNKTNDGIQDFLGIEGANHALVVAGVNVNPNNPSDTKVVLIDSGTGDVCIEYNFKDFNNAWKDGHCQMISTNEPAPYQYNYLTQQMEPSSFNTTYLPSMTTMPAGMNNQFHLADSYYTAYADYIPLYCEEQTHSSSEIGAESDSSYTMSESDETMELPFNHDDTLHNIFENNVESVPINEHQNYDDSIDDCDNDAEN